MPKTSTRPWQSVMAERVRIVEVGPRDGLQNEPRAISVAQKVALIDALSQAGLAEIEIGAFVRPDRVPQMAGTPEVMAGITPARAAYTALVPNMRGLEAFLEARPSPAFRDVAVFVSASEGFSRANINASVAESLTRLAPVMEGAAAAGLRVRGYVSCVTDCPYDGPTPPEAVARVAAALDQMGCREVSLGETIGRGTPDAVAAMLEEVTRAVPPVRLAGHFHDTNGQAIENIDVALAAGLRVFDASVAGLGGCPFAPGAAGNVATEEVLAHLTARGYETGLDEAALAKAVDLARAIRGESDGHAKD